MLKAETADLEGLLVSYRPTPPLSMRSNSNSKKKQSKTTKNTPENPDPRKHR